MSGAKEKKDVRKLSDGRSLEVVPLKGKHLMMAQQMTAGNPSGLMLALCALGAPIEGKQVVYEDLLEEDAFVVMELMAAVVGDKVENFMSATPAPSFTTGT